MSSIGLTEVAILTLTVLFYILVPALVILVVVGFWRKLTRIEEQLKEIQERIKRQGDL